jgi:hypothetical protein
MANYLLLKWGTLKGWNVENRPELIQLMREYHEIGSNFSAMMQKDTPRQKEIILELIDKFDGPIQNDWDGTMYDKQAAKDYILNYGIK